MNSITKLAIRTKESFSELYSFNNEQASTIQEIAGKPPIPPTSETAGLEKFEVLRDGSPSPGKECPSKRKRLLGSLRSIGSMRKLKSGNVKIDAESAIQGKTSLRGKRPSLALNFDDSAFNDQMFEFGRCAPFPRTVDVRHRHLPLKEPESVPVSVPHHPGLSALVIGSTPDTSTPIQASLQHETTTCQLYNGAAPPQLTLPPGAHDVPTMSLPGIDLPVQGDSRALGISVSSPSLTMKERDKLPDNFNPPVAAYQKNSDYTNSVVLTSRSNLRDHTGVTATEPTEVDGVQTITSRSSPKFKPANSKESSILNVNDEHVAPDAASQKSWQAKKDMVPAYLAFDGAQDGTERNEGFIQRRPSTWSRHSGLYDGTGYGDIETAFNTPLPSFPIDEEKAWREILSAYGATVYEEEATETQVNRLVDRLSKEEVEAFGEEISDLKEDVADSINMMNRSLGG